MLTKLVSIIMIIGLTYLFFKMAPTSVHDESDHDENIEFLSVSEAIDEINHTKNQLASIEEMITDVSICSPDEHGKYISCEWMSSLGNKYKYDLFVDGVNDASEEMLKIAYSERARLRTLLRQQIRNLSDRCNGNGNGNYDVVNREGRIQL